MEKEIIIIADYSQQQTLNLSDLCHLTGLSEEDIYLLIEHEIILPTGNSPKNWQFDMAQLTRINIALRLQRDLEINLPGIALILELLDKLEELEEKNKLLERFFSESISY